MKKYSVLALLVLLALLQGCTSSIQATVEPLPPEEKPSPPEKLVITAVGDIMVHNTQLAAAHRPDTGSYDFAPFFSVVKPLLQAAHLTIGNLETTLAGPQTGYSGYPRFNTPAVLAADLKDCGFDVLTTANNHCLDRGEAGLLQTIRHLDEAGVLHTGTFSTKEEQSKPLITEVKGVKIAILAYTYGTNGIALPKNSQAAVNRLDPRQITRDIAAAKALEAELILVALHFGEEYRAQPTVYQTQLAGEILEAGADIIIGHHPHVLEPVVLCRQDPEQGSPAKLVAYSLGNFVSDQKGVERRTSLILNLYFTLEPITGKPIFDKATYVPIWTHRYQDQDRLAFRVVPVEPALFSIRTGGNDRFSPSDIKELEKAWSHVSKTMQALDPAISLLDLSMPLEEISALTSIETE